jgi:hypothetical protein
MKLLDHNVSFFSQLCARVSNQACCCGDWRAALLVLPVIALLNEDRIKRRMKTRSTMPPASVISASSPKMIGHQLYASPVLGSSATGAAGSAAGAAAGAATGAAAAAGTVAVNAVFIVPLDVAGALICPGIRYDPLDHARGAGLDIFRFQHHFMLYFAVVGDDIGYRCACAS